MPDTPGARPKYFIHQARSVQGPFDAERIRAWIAEGRVRPDMEFSVDRENWIAGHAMPGWFEASPAPASAPSPPPDTTPGIVTSPIPVALIALGVVGLVGTALEFVAFEMRFSPLGAAGHTAWSNLFGIAGSLLFAAVAGLGLARILPAHARKVSHAGSWCVAAGLAQVLFFVVCAGVLRIGWIGDAERAFEAADLAAEAGSTHDEIERLLDQAGSSEADRRRARGLGRLGESLLEQFTLRPVHGPGMYWLAVASLGVVAAGAALRREVF